MNIKLKFVGADEISDGLMILADDLSFSINELSPDCTVHIEKSIDSKLYLSLSDNIARIRYTHTASAFRMVAKLSSLM